MNRAVAYLPMPKKTSRLKVTKVSALAEPELASRLVEAFRASRASDLGRTTPCASSCQVFARQPQVFRGVERCRSSHIGVDGIGGNHVEARAPQRSTGRRAPGARLSELFAACGSPRDSCRRAPGPTRWLHPSSGRRARDSRHSTRRSRRRWLSRRRRHRPYGCVPISRPGDERATWR